MSRRKITIGRYDLANLPELGLENLKVKVDTGAYSCALHATGMKVRKYRGRPHLYFRLLDPAHPEYEDRPLRFERFSRRTVKSSNGEVQERFSIETTIEIFQESFPIVLTLTDRSSMRYPMLLGRRLLRRGFVVDVNRKNLSLGSRKKAAQK